MKLRFNIIYTRDTVKYLLIFAMSLLRWSDCSFRLVANGCTDEECDLLERFCERSKRTVFYRYPSDDILPHGTVLTHLQQMEDSEYFCFMDSDIFATSNFMDDFFPLLREYDGIFSCPPVWCEEGENILDTRNSRIVGKHNRTVNGIELGSSYFAIYDNRLLSEFLMSSDITFDKYSWEDLSGENRDILIGLGLKKERYDTGKLLNIMIQRRGFRIVYRVSSSLHHIGGFSGVKTKIIRSEIEPIFDEERYKRGSRSISDKILSLLKRRGDGKSIHAKRKRVFVNEFFRELIFCLSEGIPFKGELSEINNEVDENIKRTVQHLHKIYEEFYPSFSELR